MTERTERISANEAVADLGNEILLLVEMIVEHAAPWLDALIAAGHTGSGLFAADSDDASQPGCGWCPHCAVVAMARGDRPEFSARAIEQLAQLIGVLRAVLADRWYPGEGIHMPGRPQAERQDGGSAWTRAPRQEAPGAAGASRAQRITVRKSAAANQGEAF